MIFEKSIQEINGHFISNLERFPITHKHLVSSGIDKIPKFTTEIKLKDSNQIFNFEMKQI